jgi:hypothetical protein
MKYIKFLMALAVACMLIIPALSMPDSGMGQDGKQLFIMHKTSNGQDGNQNQCQMPVGNDGKQWDGKQWDGKQWDGKQNQCECKGPMGQDGKQMAHRPIKSMMGKMDGNHMCCHRPIKSMMGNHDGIKAVIVSVKIIE